MIPMVVAALLAALPAQDSQAELKRRYEEELKSPFLKKAAWFTDYEQALAESRKTGKLIFAEFTRSYAP